MGTTCSSRVGTHANSSGVRQYPLTVHFSGLLTFEMERVAILAAEDVVIGPEMTMPSRIPRFRIGNAFVSFA
ncbi:hypothetical protein R1flu_010589 [Riccia fluitans]|uniref:Uncharacterized protein n=1 Tax=Riccia fluitans TaxID=41844 RepID=A0ABD1Z5F0_9MARC